MAIFFFRLRIKDPKSFIDVVRKILSKTFKVVVQQITIAHENLLLFTDKYQAFYLFFVLQKKKMKSFKC